MRYTPEMARAVTSEAERIRRRADMATTKKAAKKTKRTAGKMARATVPEMTLSSRTRATVIGKWLAKRNAAKFGFWDEVLNAYAAEQRRIVARTPARTAQDMPREAPTQH